MVGYRYHTILLHLAFILLGISCVAACTAQAPPNSAGTDGAQQPTIGANIIFDPAQNGPLFTVQATAILPVTTLHLPPPDAATLAAHANQVGDRIVRVGSLTALAPATMCVIETNPGKPDPFAGLRPDERLKILLALLTERQWQQAGSPRGIGPEDLDEQQQALFLSLLPPDMTVQRVKLAATDKPGQLRYDYQGDEQTFQPDQARLRLIRKVEFNFLKPGTEETAAGGGPNLAAGDEFTTLKHGGPFTRGDVNPDGTVVAVFGVPILRMVPAHLKPGQLDFAAPALNRVIPVDSAAKTVGDLLPQIAHGTGLDLVADRRVARQPVAWRAVPGQTVRAGDVLQALCLCVMGTFRRVGASTFLLTDDIEGIGARLARLADWAEAAEAARYKTLESLNAAAAKNNPLAHVGFAPGDPYGLPPALMGRVDAAYRSALYTPGPTVAPSELPAGLQEALTRGAEYWQENGTQVRTDRVRIDTRLSLQYLFPGDIAVEAPFAENIDRQYLQAVAAPPGKPKPAGQPAAKPAPEPLPDTPFRRVLLAPLPPESGPLRELLTAAKAAGFTDVWLHVMLDDRTAQARLTDAVGAGKKIGIPIGAAVSLLKQGGMPGPEDVNILLETGTEFARRKPAGNDLIAGWTTLDPDQAIRLLLPLTRVPGLNALALRATAAPGWAGDPGGGDGLAEAAHLGYGVPVRLACIRDQGFDPLDVIWTYNLLRYRATAPLSLPYFPDAGVGDDALWPKLAEFRLRWNRQDMARIYEALHQDMPNLPLYLDDRASAYCEPNTRWYGRWDIPEKVPVNPIYSEESQTRAVAAAASSEPLLSRKGWYGNPIDLALALDRTAQQASQPWRGLTLDLTALTPAQALNMVIHLPRKAR